MSASYGQHPSTKNGARRNARPHCRNLDRERIDCQTLNVLSTGLVLNLYPCTDECFIECLVADHLTCLFNPPKGHRRVITRAKTVDKGR